MRRLPGFRRAARVPAERAADVAREVDEELAFHLAMREERLRARGLTPDDAAAEARRRFGDVDAVRAECVDSDAAELRSLRWHERAADLARDLRIAFRSLRRSPGFAVAAASLLALGIGGTTSVFSIVDAIYFRPLPYPNADRLAIAQATFPDPRCGGRCARQPAMAEVALWQRQARSIDAIGAIELRQGEVDVAAGSLVLEGAAVSAELPSMLGLRAAVGRVFVASDFTEGAPGVIVLGHAAWESEFGGDSAIVGQTATIDSASYRIVGVLAPESELGSPLYSFNARTAAYLVPQERWSTTVNQVVVRLRPGVTLSAAVSELAFVLRSTTGGTWQATVVRLRDAYAARYRGSFTLLLGAAAIVLALTCVNVGGLLAARLNDRMPELSTRAVLGAGRAQLVQQVLTETGLVAGAGAVGGVLLAFYGTRAARLIPAERLPFWTPIVMDARVVVLAVVLALVGGALLSIAPVFRLSPARMASGVRELVSAPPGRARMRSILVGAEIALSVVLVAVAGILVKQLVAAEERDLATSKRSVVFVALSARNGATDASWSDRTIAGLRGLPGVTTVAVSGMEVRARVAPRRDSVVRRPGALRRAQALFVEGRDEPVTGVMFPLATVVTRDYFVSVGTPLVAGRVFSASDNASAPAAAIINAGAAHRVFGSAPAIGRRIRIESGGVMGEWLTIVGVTADQRVSPFDSSASARSQLFRPWTQVAAVPATIAVHVVGDSRLVAPLLRGALHVIDPSAPVASISPIEAWVDAQLWSARFTTDLLTAFALFALALACLGVYALVSYVVARRRRELAIRVAVGATSVEIIASVLGPTARLVTAAVVLGAIGAFATARLLRSMLFGSDGLDVTVLTAAVSAILITGFVAAYLPARRAAAADPLAALRSD